MKNNSGFTLMEMMVVIGIIGILAAIVTPNLISWRSNHQLNSTAREFQAVLSDARYDAIKNNARVLVTLDSTAGTIQTSMINRATGVQRSATFECQPGISMSYDFGTASFRFNSRGLPILQDGTFASGQITFQNPKNRQLAVSLSSTGNTLIEAP